MRSAWDQLYVWMTHDGHRCIDLFDHEEGIQVLQYLTLSALQLKHGINRLDGKLNAKTDKYFDELMYGEDGHAWIQHAKDLGVIRKRTKQERIQQDRQLA